MRYTNQTKALMFKLLQRAIHKVDKESPAQIELTELYSIIWDTKVEGER